MGKRIVSMAVLIFALLMPTSCRRNNNATQVTLNDHSIVLPQPFSELSPVSQIGIAMSITGEEYSLDKPIADTTSSYLKQVATSLTGLKPLMSEKEYAATGDWELYRDLKEVWLAYQYDAFDEYRGDTEISQARINLFAEHHSAYMAGKMKFPKWEFRKLMQEPNFYWAVQSNHGYTPVSYALELEYLMEYGLAGLKSIIDVADVISPDGKAGILSFDSQYNDDFSQSIILLETDRGIVCNLWFIDDWGYVSSNHYTSITQTENADGGTSYIFSWKVEGISLERAPARTFKIMNEDIVEL